MYFTLKSFICIYIYSISILYIHLYQGNLGTTGNSGILQGNLGTNQGNLGTPADVDPRCLGLSSSMEEIQNMKKLVCVCLCVYVCVCMYVSYVVLSFNANLLY
jgi:hypothetical protein